MELYDYEKRHLETLRAHLAECTVLLKTNGAFPLSAPCRIAAYGGGVRRTVKGGTGSGDVNSRFFVTVYEGLSRAGFTVTTDRWLDAYEEKRAAARKSFIKRLKAEAKAAGRSAVLFGLGRVMPEPEYDLPLSGEGDAAIYVLARSSGEGGDRAPVRGDVKLTEAERRDILALNRQFERFMLVLNVGGPVDLSEVQEVGNILLLSQLGVETGAVLADILLGKENPSGRLTDTWAAWEDYPALGSFGDADDTRYREGVYVGYRYFDSVGKRALFPFGHGLSYTSFERKVLHTRSEGGAFTVAVTVSNTGERPGREVVQCYVSPPQGRLDKPYQSLAAFAKTRELSPGERETLTLRVDLRESASYDALRSAYILEPGDYVLRVGSSSAQTVPAAILRVPEERVVRQLRPALGKPDFEDWRPEQRVEEALPEGLPTLILGDTEPQTVVYDAPEAVDDAVKALPDETLVYLNVGAFDPTGRRRSIIGNASSRVAGAAGETSSVLKDAGCAPIVMADGPAGLRLSRDYYRDGTGAHAVGTESLTRTIAELLPAPAGWAFRLLAGKRRAPRGARLEHQYCTAIPIGTALAQSWNTDFARICGDLVGSEMERFGVQLWLAPALNIHRSILCGRNFEYYSEDPLISGAFAAAVTQGVQAHPGCGTTIKHFAANNQEFNRYGNNSLVSERAMREIYLRGFGICVREAQPAAVMTSYNLLNGVHTAERRDLCQDILRSEFGFRGIIMTDWVVGGVMTSREDAHPAVRQHRVAAAGGDLFMPGGKRDYEDILNALRSGSLSRGQLEINATRVLRMSRRLNRQPEQPER